MRTSSRLREGPDRRTLKGAAIARSCLIVEDELLIGVDLEDTIQSAGFEVRWVASLKRALASVDQNPPDVAVIDVALHDGSSTELARELMRREIPFVVHSGFPAEDAPSDLRGITWLSKPSEPSAVLDAINKALRAAIDDA